MRGTVLLELELPVFLLDLLALLALGLLLLPLLHLLRLLHIVQKLILISFHQYHRRSWVFGGLLDCLFYGFFHWYVRCFLRQFLLLGFFGFFGLGWVACDGL